MELDIETKQHLTDLLAKPAMVSDVHIDLLSILVKKYPYYQPLHLLLAKASKGKPNFEQALTLASLYNGGHLAYQMAKNIGVFGDDTLVIEPELEENSVNDEQETFEEINELAPSSRDEHVEQEKIEQETFEEINEFINAPADEEIQQEEVEEETFEEIAEIQHIPFEKETVAQQDDVFDEITEVDTLAFATLSVTADEFKVTEEQTQELEVPEEEITAVPDELAIESIVSSDFFAFEQNFNTETISNETILVTQPEEYNQEAEAQTVSKYDDDKLPYTFLWWLAKTRKEHEQIFQPYVSAKQSQTVQQGDLQHQYVEHIFHLQTPFNVADEASKGPVNLKIKPKGIEIIDSFIKNDPQIKAPKAEQINTENKAKKSAEDNYDLVSETLAAIYIEQMLYHKAIDTYEKLSLKFPEKSRYFADLIQSLEKKI